MTNEQIIEACLKYDKILADKGIEIERQIDKPGSLPHIRYMCNQIIVHINVGKIEKAHRWLGFVQGSFWVLSIFNIEQMKDDNR